MEHISRLTTNNVNLLLVVSDSTRRGIQAASRIYDLTRELGLRIDKRSLIVNQAKDGQEAEIRKRAKEFGLEVTGIIPDDPLVRQFDLEGKPTTELTAESAALNAAFAIFDALLQ
jgi:CO dehydrogenase maturation factor